MLSRVRQFPKLIRDLIHLASENLKEQQVHNTKVFFVKVFSPPNSRKSQFFDSRFLRGVPPGA